MTAIVAITNGKNVWMADDSFCGSENVLDLCKSAKVYKIGKLGIGLCGRIRQELILEKTLTKLILKDKIEITHDWLKFELPDILVKEMRMASATSEKNGQLTLGDSSYMLAFDGKIYYLDDDFGIWDSQRDIAAIGAGRYYALGSLQTLQEIKNNLSPEKKLIKSLEVSTKWSVWVAPPYTVIKV